MTRFIWFLLVACTCIGGGQFVHAQPVPESDSALAVAERAFREGGDLLQQDQYAAAFARFREGLSAYPESPGLLYNGGMAAYLDKRYDTAVVLWRRFESLYPLEWTIYPKLVQGYQALGDTVQRDSMRARLFALRRSDEDTSLTSQHYYTRDQFQVGNWWVTAYEHYALEGDRAVRYAFAAHDVTGKKKDLVISLGSYDLTNEVWHQTTTPRPGEDERLFHLDSYSDEGHATYGMFAPEPSYDDTRVLVTGVLQNKLKPQSSSSYPAAAEKKAPKKTQKKPQSKPQKPAKKK